MDIANHHLPLIEFTSEVDQVMFQSNIQKQIKVLRIVAKISRHFAVVNERLRAGPFEVGKLHDLNGQIGAGWGIEISLQDTIDGHWYLLQVSVHAGVQWQTIGIGSYSLCIVPSASNFVRLFIANHWTKLVWPSSEVSKGTQASGSSADYAY